MNGPTDSSDVLTALAALAVVLLPMLLARWLIGHGGDPPADDPDGTQPRPGADAQPPRAAQSDSVFFTSLR